MKWISLICNKLLDFNFQHILTVIDIDFKLYRKQCRFVKNNILFRILTTFIYGILRVLRNFEVKFDLIIICFIPKYENITSGIYSREYMGSTEGKIFFASAYI